MDGRREVHKWSSLGIINEVKRSYEESNGWKERRKEVIYVRMEGKKIQKMKIFTRN